MSQLEAGSFWPVDSQTCFIVQSHISMNVDEHDPRGFLVIITSTPEVWVDHPSLFRRLGEVFGTGSLLNGKQCCSV